MALLPVQGSAPGKRDCGKVNPVLKCTAGCTIYYRTILPARQGAKTLLPTPYRPSEFSVINAM